MRNALPQQAGRRTTHIGWWASGNAAQPTNPLLATIRAHCEGFVRARLAPANPKGDGRQTPMRGHPVFVAQHACACCSALARARLGCFPMGRNHPQGAVTSRLPREVVARAARGRDSRRTAAGHRRFPDGVDRAGDGGAEPLRHRNNGAEIKSQLFFT